MLLEERSKSGRIYGGKGTVDSLGRWSSSKQFLYIANPLYIYIYIYSLLFQSTESEIIVKSLKECVIEVAYSAQLVETATS